MLSIYYRPPDGWITIKDAAARLEVSEKTIRRKIKKNELEAKLTDSPWGELWIINENQINKALEVVDVVTVKKEHDLKELALAISYYLDEKDENTRAELKKLHEENKNIKDEIEKIERLTEENSRKTDQLLRLTQKFIEEKNKPWYKKIFKK